MNEERKIKRKKRNKSTTTAKSNKKEWKLTLEIFFSYILFSFLTNRFAKLNYFIAPCNIVRLRAWHND